MEGIVQNNEQAVVSIDKVFDGLAGVRDATQAETLAFGCDKVVAFYPKEASEKPSKAASLSIGLDKFDILRVEKSQVTAGFYVAYCKRSS